MVRCAMNARSKFQHVLRKFRQRFGRNIDKLTIRALILKWNFTGSVSNRRKGNTGKSRSVLVERNSNRVIRLLRTNPQQGTRRMSRSLGITTSILYSKDIKDFK
jgi:hypothetical protein